MVQLACSCLNIRLHVQESPESLVAGIPNLSPSERQHPFFLKGACPVTLGLGGITEGQRLLVRRCRVGNWTVLECLNCHLLTHATRGHGGDVAASTLLISDVNKIQMLQKCEGYSPAFNLVLPTTLDNQPTPPLSPTEFPGDRSPETEAALSEVQQQLSRFLKKAQSQVEANIQSYTKQQQALLQALTLRARKDRQTVMQLITNMQANMRSQSDDDILGFDMDGARGSQQQQLRSGDGFSSVMQPGDLDDRYSDDVTGLPDDPDAGLPPLVSLQGRGPSQPMSMNHTQGITAGMHNMRLSSSVAVPRAKKLQGGSRVAQSLDVEGLFDMEGMMEGSAAPSHPSYHSDDEDDSDDSTFGEDSQISGDHDSMRDLAKSVPVSVPMWPAARPKPMPDDHVVERPSDVQQMAASIKALARSVHTTSVDLFGDLPRPRQPL
ncbi:uncharacterized protein LOC126980869 [Eriocheir sinensis]|uniref:uncharacterized protein LOC126980869 n=1 Tax=Eriocheir sinensis TaxID=95602 RepID=UPI0021C5DC8F|nr:uncharacterized protein LOC126980869 [Eriocheir sinensis]XP_050687161.1 uncharacterized protein LOC126980869 [Eriocheir sinensis]